jgi:hypothetical protein
MRTPADHAIASSAVVPAAELKAPVRFEQADRRKMMEASAKQ